MMTLLGKDDYDEGYDIKSVTMNTTFSETISPLKLIDFEVDSCVLLIDEIYGILDARRSQGVNGDMSYFFFQCGKRDVKVIATAQLIRTVDIRVIELLSEKIEARKIINPDKTVKEFRYLVSNGYQTVELVMPLDVAKKVYPLYNHKQIIMPLYISGKDICEWEDVLGIFKESPTKKSFEAEIKLLNPYVTGDMVSSCYDLLKAEKPDRAKRVLNL
jgi:hypothetical protein